MLTATDPAVSTVSNRDGIRCEVVQHFIIYCGALSPPRLIVFLRG